MFQIIVLVFSMLMFISCSENATNDTSDSKYMSITKAPVNGGVDITQVLSIEFSSEIDLSSLVETFQENIDTSTLDTLVYAPSLVLDSTLFPVHLKDGNGTVVKAVLTQDENNANKIIITPFRYLDANLSYTLVVTTAVQDVYGKSLSEDYELSFITSDDGGNPNKLLEGITVNPSSDPSFITDVKTDIAIEFASDIAYSDTALFVVTDVNTSLEVNGTFEYFNTKCTFYPFSDLILGHSYDVNITTTYLSDMYGNEFNVSAGTSWTFSVDVNQSGYNYLTTQGVVNIGAQGYLVRNFENADANVTYVAVAKEGGLDLYQVDYNISTYEPILSKSNYNVSIDSKVTDMIYETNSHTLLVSTELDGLYSINLDTNGVLSVVKYLENVTNISGVGYGYNNTTAQLDRIYAVGPTIGLYTLKKDLNSSTFSSSNISINGDPLKVLGYDGASGRKVFVSDYTNGIRIYDDNATQDALSPIVIEGNINHIVLGDGNGEQVYGVTLLGNVFSIAADNPSTITEHGSGFTGISDLSGEFYTLYMSMSNKGMQSISPYYTPAINNELDGVFTPQNVVSGYSYNGMVVLLTKDGLMYIYSSGY